MTTEVGEVGDVSKGTMYLRGIRADIVREAKALAAREGVTLTALVERVLGRATSAAHPSARLSDIAADMAWFSDNESLLLERYDGEHLAILDGEVVDHDLQVDVLLARVAERFGDRSVYMPECVREHRRAELRSPRVAR